MILWKISHAVFKGNGYYSETAIARLTKCWINKARLFCMSWSSKLMLSASPLYRGTLAEAKSLRKM